jgi:hypothetical protein
VGGGRRGRNVEKRRGKREEGGKRGREGVVICQAYPLLRNGIHRTKIVIMYAFWGCWQLENSIHNSLSFPVFVVL